MSCLIQVDPEWMIERILAGKIGAEVGDEIADMILGAMAKEGQEIRKAMLEMLGATSTVAAVTA